MRLRAWCCCLLLALPAAAPRAQDTGPVLAVVVAASRPAQNLDAADLAQIYKRRRLYWADGARIEPVNLPADHPLRRRFTRHVLRLSQPALEDYWNEQYFHGVLPPHVLASEAAVLRFVADTRDAVGYLSLCALDARVRPLLLLDAAGAVVPPAQAPACTQD